MTMSKEYVRQLVMTRFNEFAELSQDLKTYPNLPEPKQPFNKPWARLKKIDFVLHKVASIGQEPCTRRTGVIIIESFDNLGKGTQPLTVLTDKIEQYFGLWSTTNFWTDPANTIDNEDDKSKIYYKFTTYVPFVLDVVPLSELEKLAPLIGPPLAKLVNVDLPYTLRSLT